MGDDISTDGDEEESVISQIYDVVYVVRCLRSFIKKITNLNYIIVQGRRIYGDMMHGTLLALCGPSGRVGDFEEMFYFDGDRCLF